MSGEALGALGLSDAGDPPPGGAPAGDPPTPAAAGEDGKPVDPPAGDKPADGPKWFDDVSADAPDDKTLSDKAWLENKKFATPADLVKAARSLESKLGIDKVPADAKGYEIPVPEGQDPAFAGQFAETALKLGIPAPMAKGLAEWWNEQQAGAVEAAEAAQTARDIAERGELKKAWGADFAKNSEIIGRAAERFGFTAEHVAGLKATLGVKATAEKLFAIGKAMGEDTLDGGGKRDLGGMTLEQASERKATILADKDAMKKIQNKDPGALREWQQIAEVEAAARDRAAAA